MTKTKKEIYVKYLSKEVNPILERLILDLMHEMPENVLQFINKWTIDKIKRDSKKHSVKELFNNDNNKNHKDFYGDISNSDEDGEDEVNDLEFENKLQKKKLEKIGRSSVSAEVYGTFNTKSEYKPKVIYKNEEQIKRIKDKLEQAFMFSALDHTEKDIVINAFDEIIFYEGDTVIQQGEEGDNLYVVDSGELDCYKTFKGNDHDTHLKVYQPGEAFGELALLYNAPRAATIIAKTNCVLWALDRECFNHIVKDAASRKRESYENFLSKIELLHDIDPYERSKIADAFKSIEFKAGQNIVTEGEKGDCFYFIERGKAFASKIINKGNPPQKVLDYKEGDYFGELSLLRDSDRAASVIAKTNIKLVSLDRNSFKRLIGPLEEILKRNFDRYEKFIY